jgi:glycosyltransferase involved in cell wall biosynthesis
MPSVSLVIPVFNKAPYLRECINSLVNQSFADCEFILVNDGSTDGSMLILEEFQQKNPRIELINQENKGVSAARNAGISVAKGTYLTFVDADDVLDLDFVKSLYEQAITTGAEIVASSYYTLFLDNKIIQPSNFPINKKLSKEVIQEEVIPFVIQDNSFNPVCTKLFLTSLIKSNAIVFPDDILNGEDGLFVIQALHHANSLICIDYAGYYYREVSGSAVRNSNEKDYFNLALEHFNFDYKAAYGIIISENKLSKLKSIQLLNTVLSLTYIYYHSEISNKKHYLKNMISNPVVQSSLTVYWDEICNGKENYQKFLLFCIKIKSVWLLSLAIKYSDFRNPKVN